MSESRWLRRVAAVLALVLAVASKPALAEESILSFDALITISEDGSMEVTERIRVRAEGRDIRRGIYRAFPTRYRDQWGNEVIVDFEVLSAKRDGQPERWFAKDVNNGVHVYLGRENYFLPTGEYTYEIRYRTDHQMGFYEEFDELYWNATGNGWMFAIEQSSARVQLPKNISRESLRLAAYTGYQGGRGSDADIQVLASGEVLFTTQRSLRPYEGLTIGVGFPKGILPEPTGSERLARLMKHNAGILVGVLGLLAVLGYYIQAWHRVGRDPKAGIIIPRYEPPEGYSPAALRYIWRRKFDSGCFSAALVNLAVKGELNIRQSQKFLNNKFSVKPTPETAGKQPLAAGESVLLDKLLGGRRSRLYFDNKNHRRIRGALRAHERSLDDDYGHKYFNLNGGLISIGLFASAVVVVFMFVLSRYTSVAMLVTVAALAIVNFCFYKWLEAPTMRGRKVLDHIEGFRLYLGVAERSELERHREPLPTFEEFEKQLPYAIALDCASTWADRFEDELKRLEQAGQLRQRNWYSGRGNISVSNITNSVNGLGRSLGGAISSSSTPPGSSSSGGSGGGGFSGGGGGGGGGGGW